MQLIEFSVKMQILHYKLKLEKEMNGMQTL